mmetsp:Transcript_41663/g.75634  ORF Transcript_41663/g.75634 Transcript_41663/m.75634 type:complete len:449 (+) Transcript_41663:37-1383(+)
MLLPVDHRTLRCARPICKVPSGSVLLSVGGGQHVASQVPATTSTALPPPSRMRSPSPVTAIAPAPRPFAEHRLAPLERTLTTLTHQSSQRALPSVAAVPCRRSPSPTLTTCSPMSQAQTRRSIPQAVRVSSPLRTVRGPLRTVRRDPVPSPSPPPGRTSARSPLPQSISVNLWSARRSEDSAQQAVAAAIAASQGKRGRCSEVVGVLTAAIERQTAAIERQTSALALWKDALDRQTQAISRQASATTLDATRVVTRMASTGALLSPPLDRCRAEVRDMGTGSAGAAETETEFAVSLSAVHLALDTPSPDTDSHSPAERVSGDKGDGAPSLAALSTSFGKLSPEGSVSGMSTCSGTFPVQTPERSLRISSSTGALCTAGTSQEASPAQVVRRFDLQSASQTDLRESPVLQYGPGNIEAGEYTNSPTRKPSQADASWRGSICGALAATDS